MAFGYFSALIGVGVAVILVIVLTYIMKDQVMKIRVPQLKLGMSALLATIATIWILEVFLNLNEIIAVPLFVVYFLAVQALVKI